MGYKKATVRLDFPDLVDLGDECYVIIKNPRLQPGESLIPDDVDENDFQAVKNATYLIVANLIVDWRVWDPADESDDPPVMPLPATSESVAKLPMEIFTTISDEIAAALPLQPTP